MPRHLNALVKNSDRIWVMNTYPKIIENFISDEEIDMFVEFLDKHVKPNHQREGILACLGYGTSLEASEVGYTRSAMNGFENTPEQEVVDAIGRMVVATKEAMEAEFGELMDTVNFNYQQVIEGGSGSLHSDNSTLEGDPLQPDGTPEEVEWSGLLYFNTCGVDYEGGEIEFPKQNLIIRPKRGQLVMFPGNVNYPHEVLTVKSGIRKNFVSFFARKGNVSGNVEFFARDENYND